MKSSSSHSSSTSRISPAALVAVVSIFASGGLLFACAGSENPDDGVGTAPADAGKVDSATKPAASTPPKDAATPDTCAPTCATDNDCSKTCAAVSAGSVCCDNATKKCFRFTGSACPVPQPPPDAATPPGPY